MTADPYLYNSMGEDPYDPYEVDGYAAALVAALAARGVTGVATVLRFAGGEELDGSRVMVGAELDTPAPAQRLRNLLEVAFAQPAQLGRRGPAAAPPSAPATQPPPECDLPQDVTDAPSAPRRTPPKRKARQLAEHLREERPDYAYPSSPTAATPAAKAWRSTAAAPSPTPKPPTTRPSPASPSEPPDQDHPVCGS